MTQVTEAMHHHHEELAKTLGEQVRLLVEDPAHADPTAFARFLTQDLLPHAQGEERYLYPTVDPLINAYSRPSATMSIDHEVIGSYIERIGAIAKAVATAEAAERVALLDQLARLGLQLDGIFRLHLRKEEAVYLPLFERYVAPAEQQRVLEAMHSVEPAAPPTDGQLLDVRPIEPRQRHDLIFQTFEALQPDDAFTLVNDHDPKPLYYQFHCERDGEFTWEYLERGPEAWRVRIGKVAPAGAAS